MADPRFFIKSKSFSVAEIASVVSCKISSNKNNNLLLEDVRSLKEAQKNHLSFLDNIKYKKDFLNTKAGACFVLPKMAKIAPKNVICLITENPYKDYALAAQLFYPEIKPNNKTANSAIISSSAKIHKEVIIGNNVIIEDHVEIGKGTWIEAGTIIKKGVKIGDNCHIGSQATISHTLIGNNVRIYTGVRIGQDGFGFAIDPQGHVKVPQLGRVIIEDYVEIGANTTIDRGSSSDTVIGQGTWIDNLVQIGHNVKIGKGCIIVAQVGISGSTIIDDYVAIGGQAGIAGHLHIGTAAQIGAQSGVMNDLEAKKEYMGSPAFPKTHYFRQLATLNSLIKKRKKD